MQRGHIANWEYKIVIDGIEFFDQHIISCTSENASMVSNFEIGNVISGRLDITVLIDPLEEFFLNTPPVQETVRYSVLSHGIIEPDLIIMSNENLRSRVPRRMAKVEVFIREWFVPDFFLSQPPEQPNRAYQVLPTDTIEPDDIIMAGTMPGEWRPKGKYYIAHRSSDRNHRTLTLECHGIMRSFAQPFRAEGLQPDFPMTMAQALQHIASGTGVEFDSRNVLNPAYTIDYTNERTIQEVMSDIASANAGNWIENYDGTLRLLPATHRGQLHDIDTDVYDYRDKNHPLIITRTTMFYDDGEEDFYTAGDDSGYEIVVENANATQAMVNNVHAIIGGHEHLSFETHKGFLDPFFEIGDVVHVADRERIINGYVMHFSATIASSVFSPSDDEIHDEFKFQGDMTLALRRRIKEGSNYFGVSITRREGLRITHDWAPDNRGTTLINSRVWEASFNGQRALHFDIENRRFVFNGSFGVNAQEAIGQTIDLAGVVRFLPGTNILPSSSGANVTNINGGNITTGTINASLVNVTNINASNLTTGTINANTISIINLDASNITTGLLDADLVHVSTLWTRGMTPYDWPVVQLSVAPWGTTLMLGTTFESQSSYIAPRVMVVADQAISFQLGAPAYSDSTLTILQTGDVMSLSPPGGAPIGPPTTYNLGTTSRRFDEIWADTFNGERVGRSTDRINTIWANNINVNNLNVNTTFSPP